jgi:hypothetical protein
MKANEAPERIWINSPQDLPCGFVDKNSVEYVRTDVFVKKACEIFCKVRCKDCPPRSTCISLGTCIEYDEFIKAMKLWKSIYH